MRITSASVLLSTVLFTGAHASITDVDLELSLVVDVSGSVDSSEFNLMMEGYARAFENPQIQSAITGGSIGAIVVNMVQFASSAAEVIPWTVLDSAAASNLFATTIRNTPESGAVGGSTGIGEGIATAAAGFGPNGYEAPRQVIDVSGDGTNNTGQAPAVARDAALAGGVDTINGIVISDASGAILAEYQSDVIGGVGAFAVSADDFADFENEILAKLNAEIRGVTPSGGLNLLAIARNVSVLMTNGMFEDVNGRLFRARAGFREPSTMAVAGSWTEPSVEDSGKGVLPPPPGRKPWEVFGSVGVFFNDVEQMDGINAAGGPQVLVPGYDMTMLHGTVGIEYDFAQHYSLGAALLGATGEIEVDGANPDIDVESLGVALYGTYYRENALSALGSPIEGDVWADLLYAYQNTDFDVSGGGGSSETDTHRVEFNTGLNFKQGQITHGPLGGLVWVDGDVDTSGGGPSADLESLVTRLGYQASYRIATDYGDIIPQVRATWEHEFEDDAVIVQGVNLGEPDSDKAVLGAGVLWHFHQDFYALLDYEARLGDDSDSHNVVLRVGGFF